MSTTEITFINHASVKIEEDNTCLLCDPWYSGDAFNRGWNLLVEHSGNKVQQLLNNVSYIWVSHEHPDHFSVKFFKENKKQIIENDITILFQQIKDKRVVKFLEANSFKFIEIPFDKRIAVGTFFVTCIKDGFYDSALFIETSDKKILNLNDCEITNRQRALEVRSITGQCDVLLTQFSYAAWKGGKDNKSWREKAAQEKLNSIKLQVEFFKPKWVIPFASFIYFSNNDNKYLNDSANTPRDVALALSDYDAVVQVMKPFDTFNFQNRIEAVAEAISFWDKQIKKINKKKFNSYDQVPWAELDNEFLKYKSRIFKNNSKLFISIVKRLSPVRAFQPIVILLKDLEEVVEVNIFDDHLTRCSREADLSMSSESLKFLFSNSFGFDTLTVNGCFEELKINGFTKAAKSLAIENLNNLGISFSPKILFNFAILSMFYSRLLRVAKKIRLANKT